MPYRNLKPVYFLLAFIFMNGRFSYGQTSALPDTALINRLNAASFQLIKEYPDSAEKLARQAIRLSEPFNYLQGLGDAYVRLGILEKDRGNYPESINYYKSSLGYRLKIGDKDLIARVYNNIGMAYSKKSEYDSAAFYLVKALSIAEELQLMSAQAMYSMNLGIAYEKNKDYDLALQYNRQARELYESDADSQGVLKCLINEGGIMHARKDYEDALRLYRSAIVMAGILENEREKYLAVSDLAITFMNMEQHDSAAYYLTQSLQYHRESENDPAVAIDLSNIGILYGKMNRPDSARWYLQESMILAETIGDIQLAARNASELAEILSTSGNFQKAFEYQQKFILYNDSVFSISKAEAIADMQTKYETEKKENEIIVLNKDNEIQQQQLARKSQFQNFLIAGVALLAIISALFFNRFKLKKKIESQEALLNERKRISSELHDDLGAQLSTARMFLSKLKSSQETGDNHAIIDSSLSLIDGSITDLRRIMDDLQASTLQEKGIIAATEELVNKINHLQQINFNLSHHGLEERLHVKTEHQLFRITQELINNTLKYANARNVTIDLLVRDDKVILLFEDDGKGFDLVKAKRGYGLSNIESRARSMGGEADFDSRPGAGSRTTIEMPLLYAAAKA